MGNEGSCVKPPEGVTVFVFYRRYRLYDGVHGEVKGCLRQNGSWLDRKGETGSYIQCLSLRGTMNERHGVRYPSDCGDVTGKFDRWQTDADASVSLITLTGLETL